MWKKGVQHQTVKIENWNHINIQSKFSFHKKLLCTNIPLKYSCDLCSHSNRFSNKQKNLTCYRKNKKGLGSVVFQERNSDPQKFNELMLVICKSLNMKYLIQCRWDLRAPRRRNTKVTGFKKSLITVKRSKESKGKVIKGTWEMQKIIYMATWWEKIWR